MSKLLGHRLWRQYLSPLFVGSAQIVAVLVFALGNWLLILPAHQASALKPAVQQLSQPCGNPGTPTAVHHVIWIMMENEVYNKVIGNTAGAPYQNQLASQCGAPSNMYSESHGSLINYMSATNGQSITTNNQFVAHNDCTPNTSFCNSTTSSIYSQIDSAGQSWRGYAEDMPSNCYKSNTGSYAVRHNPAVYYTGLSDCAQFDVPMGNLASQSGAFYSDVQNGALPNFSFITPNLIDDAHDSSVTVGDTWLSQIIPLITNGANYQSGDTTIFIANDEGGAGTPDHVIGEDCANQALATAQPSCHIPTIVVAPYVPAGSQDATFYSHYSMLRSTEELLGLPLLGLAATANSMTNNLNLGPGGTTPPSLQPVSNLAATAVSVSQINLNWNASALATSYSIQRNGVTVGTTTGNSFNDSGLNPGTTYSYSVVASDGLGNIAASNPVSSTTLSTNVVQWITNQSLEANLTGWTGTYNSASKNSQIFGGYDGLYSLRSVNNSAATGSNGFIDKPHWIDGSVSKATVAGTVYTSSIWVKADTVGQKISLYLRELNSTGGAMNKAPYNLPVTVTATTTNWFNITEAYPAQATGDSLAIYINASNVAAGQGFNTDLMSLTSPGAIATDTTPPTAASNFTAVPVSQTQINLIWTAATDNVGVTNYTITRNGSQLATTTGTSFSDTGLTANTAYSYAIVASDAALNNGPVAIAGAATPPILGTPANVQAVSPNPSEIDLSWSAALGATGYIVERDGVTVGVSAGTSYVDTGLNALTTYTYTVVATDVFDGSAASLPLPVTTSDGTDTVPPSQATNFLALAANQTQVNLSWAAATDNTGVTGYNISRDGTPIGSTSSLNFSDTNLTANTTYSYSVVAFDAANNIGPAATAAATTPSVLGTPSNVQATSPGTSEIDLTWVAATGATSYNIERNGVVIGASTSTAFADTGLTASTTYSYRVIATDMYSGSAASSITQATTQVATTPPPLTLCGNVAPVTAIGIKHVIILMLENNSYKQVVGSSNAPYQTSLTQSCGVATAMFGASHTSAVNYLATSAGEYPAASPPGCGSVKTCADASNNLYHQLDSVGLTWRSYQESMASACGTSAVSGLYKIGHNPPLFYSDIPSAECKANDLAVSDLTAQSGAFWNDITNQTLPSLSWVAPNLLNDGDAAGGLKAADNWTKTFVANLQQSASYQSGNTLLLITYDEGSGSDSKTGEDCTNQSLDMPVTNGISAHQDSCHVPFFVVYPYVTAGTSDGTFFDHYSVTKTVEDLFGLPYLAHAADSQTNSLVSHFAIKKTP